MDQNTISQMVADLNGNIFAVIGDQDVETELQNVENGIFDDVGIILRVGLTNEIKSPSSSDSPNDHYYGVGIRNSFGLSVDPITGNLWMTENGPDRFDEINLVENKFNSGWAKIIGPIFNQNLEKIPPYEDYIYSDPEFSWELPIGITAIDITNNSFHN